MSDGRRQRVRRRREGVFVAVLHSLYSLHVTCYSRPLSDSDSDSELHSTMSVTTRANVVRLMNLTAQHSACPCHRCSSASHPHAAVALNQLRRLATPVHAVEKEYAFEVRSEHRSLQIIFNPLTRSPRPTSDLGRALPARLAWISRT